MWTSGGLKAKLRKLNLIESNGKSKNTMDPSSLCFYSDDMTKLEHNTKESSNINYSLNINQPMPE